MTTAPAPTLTLDPSDCWALLRGTAVGRLALCDGGQPTIFPINFVVDHGTIVFRTSTGTKSRAADSALVAFEADGLVAESGGDSSVNALGHASGTGRTVWSVVVLGRVATIATTTELLETVTLPLHPWESGSKERFMRLVPDTITGRSFERTSDAAPVNSEAGPVV